MWLLINRLKDKWMQFLCFLDSHLSDRAVYGLFFLLGLLHVYSAFPGGMSPDVWSQYAQVLSGHFHAHHPPLMSLVWILLDWVYAGPALMFLLSLSLLWASMILLYRTTALYSRPLALNFLFFIFVPGILSQSTMLYKDVFFGHSFILAIALLVAQQCRHSATHRPAMSYGQAFAIGLLLFFGVGVKFQAQFCVYPLVFWLCALRAPSARLIQKALVSLVLSLGMIGSHYWIQHHVSSPSHGGQMRQFFDMAGIAYLSKDISFFPAFVQTDPNFEEKLYRLYTPKWVDPYVYNGQDSLFSTRSDPAEQAALEKAFLQAVWQYPHYYLAHRLVNFGILAAKFKYKEYALICCTDNNPAALRFDYDNDRPILSAVRWYNTHYSFLFGSNWIFYLFVFFFARKALNPALPTPKRLALGIPALTAFLFLATLLFTTMASDFRYVYVIRLIGLFLLPLSCSWKIKESAPAQ